MTNYQEQLQILTEKIEKFTKIIILRHQKPDPDALGAQLGLMYLLKNKYPQKEILAHGSDNIQEFSFLGENIDIPEQEFKNKLIIILDTANTARLEGNYHQIQKEENNNYLVKIDHHPNKEPYGQLNLVNPDISSTSEYLYQIFIEDLNYSLNKLTAKNFFAGIYGDTGGFSFGNTTSTTFLRISQLVKQDFEFEELMLNLKEMTEEDVRALGWMYQYMEIKDNVGVIKLTQEKLTKLPYKKQNLSKLVNYLGVFNNVLAWTLMIEHDKFIRVNLRSKNDIDISKIAEKYNGGGHKNASGAIIKSWEKSNDIVDEIKSIIK